MLERDSGVIITIASTAGLHGSPYTSAYTASKHASVGLTRAIAAETAGTGVRANAVCPSFVDTDLTERTIQRIVQVTGRSEQEARRSVEQLAPLNRLLRPEEVAAAVVYLASDAAAAVNGQTLVLDGGGVQA
jgi:NAD(P)-dependent dehydrogenase (short-subunit alcohol dehydrogenase family)